MKCNKINEITTIINGINYGALTLCKIKENYFYTDKRKVEYLQKTIPLLEEEELPLGESEIDFETKIHLVFIGLYDLFPTNKSSLDSLCKELSKYGEISVECSARILSRYLDGKEIVKRKQLKDFYLLNENENDEGIWT